MNSDVAAEVTARKPLLTVREVSVWLNVSEGWVRDHASGRRRPILPSVKLGKSRRFREEAVDALIRDLSKDGAA